MTLKKKKKKKVAWWNDMISKHIEVVKNLLKCFIKTKFLSEKIFFDWF